ncbi:MAG: acyl carrier protein [Myxococcales bacterium]|nr:hypothetical protein [Myxococcales bacterium]MCB9756645.1 acyl carrier protein [Myxococcales bacterium]
MATALTKTELKGFLAQHARADLDSIKDDEELFSSGVIDSFAMIELLMFLEKYTGTRLGPEDIDLDHLDTVNGILRFVELKKR